MSAEMATESMMAMVFHGAEPVLRQERLPRPEPGPGQVLIEVAACAVCRTDLHVIDGDLAEPKRPLIPGHEIVGRVAARGEGVERLAIGERVGVPWLGWTCGVCAACRRGEENLCPEARFTGYHLDGGYADFALADQAYVFALPEAYSDLEAAPLLCAGLIGFRALGMAGDPGRVAIYGFGAAAHIVAQICRHEGRAVYALTRPGDSEAQDFARELGAVWAGGSDRLPPEAVDAALVFAPVGALIPAALGAVRPGGTVVAGGIHMSPIPSFAYDLLWGKRVLRSVANLTRADGEAFLDLAPRVPVRTEIVPYPLSRANQALADLRGGRLKGAAVLSMD